MLRRAIATLTLGMWGLAGSASAQCSSGPDGLNGPCWGPATPNLPSFPGLLLPGTGICWRNCSPSQDCIRVELGPPLPTPVCGQYASQVLVFDCSGIALMGGTLVLDYTRTWDEATTATRYLVYRFVAKIDFGASTLPPSCLRPPCGPAFGEIFYYGYVDYAVECASAAVEAALVLFHNCDPFTHHPLSSRPGTFHPDQSYALVAPSTAANPFVPSLVPPASGPLVAEAVRPVPLPGQACVNEDPVASGNLVNAISICGCRPALPPRQLTVRRFNGIATCTAAGIGPSSFVAVNTRPSLPWLYLMTNSIGAWTTTQSFSGPERVWVDEVPILYGDSCSAAAGGPAAFAEIYYGATTRDGFAVVPTPTVPLTQNFTDLAANVSWPLTGPPPATFMGDVRPTRNLIYVNVP